MPSIGVCSHLHFLGLLIDIAFNILLGKARANRADEVARNPDLAAPVMLLEPEKLLKELPGGEALQDLDCS